MIGVGAEALGETDPWTPRLSRFTINAVCLSLITEAPLSLSLETGCKEGLVATPEQVSVNT